MPDVKCVEVIGFPAENGSTCVTTKSLSDNLLTCNK